ncbi:AAA-like domain-containing protein, partial [Hyella patelloides]|uniref:AAA-like domain-containing protein n=1 Tax=Hyella patelloides TaxID=1982969 RepID=UPI001C953A95
IFKQTGKHLSDLEIIILRGAWDNKTYEEIAETEGYSSSYLSKDIGNKFWNNLSTALQEKVSKKNFKGALQRKWCKHTQVNLIQYQTQISESLTTKNLAFPEGSVALGSPFYVKRSRCESVCYETIVKPGSLIRIKGAKWMGKTSLVNRILEQGRNSDYKTIYLDFDSVERSIVQNLDKLLRWLCAMVSRQLKLANKVNDYWDTDILGSNDNCTVYFEEYILAEITKEIVLAVDNIDRLFAYEEVIEDFLGMLRSWHEKGKTYHCWSRLKLVLAHSTEVYIPLDINQSPFNAGVPILLEEFDDKQVKILANLYQLKWDKFEISQLMDLVGGHPYLVRLAMYHVKNQNIPLEKLLQNAVSETGIYSNSLRRLSNILNQSPELSSAFARVVQSDEPIALNSLQIYKLHSLNLVKYQQNLVSPRCKLYRNYFINQQYEY